MEKKMLKYINIDIPPEIRGVICTLLKPYVTDAEARLNELFAPGRDKTPEELHSRKEAAGRLKISLPTLDRMIKAGEIGYVKIRRSVRVPRSEVERLMKPAE
jgi:excisionase family DNA binding protein